MPIFLGKSKPCHHHFICKRWLLDSLAWGKLQLLQKGVLYCPLWDLSKDIKVVPLKFSCSYMKGLEYFLSQKCINDLSGFMSVQAVAAGMVDSERPRVALFWQWMVVAFCPEWWQISAVDTFPSSNLRILNLSLSDNCMQGILRASTENCISIENCKSGSKES